MNTTIEYYNKNAEQFVHDTTEVNFTTVQDRFLNKLYDRAYILDFGCGSGRDSRYFLERGCRVDASDGSEMMCQKASELTGLDVKQMLFDELDEDYKYDGIWACSSILHLPKKELKDVFLKMTRALKDGGVIYTSVKYGEYEGERDGRYFTDFTEESFREFIRDLEDLYITDLWITGDVRPDRGDERWLNVIIEK